MSGWLVWMYAAGSFLHFAVKPALRLNLRFFLFTVLFPIVYIVISPIFILRSRTIISDLLLPVRLFAMFCVLYDMHFVAKNLMLGEESRYLSFPDYWHLFFLVYFFPIGIWWIQTRVNRLHLNEQELAAASPMLKSN